MENNNIYIKKLESLLYSVAEAITTIDSSCSVIQFGSSIYGEKKNDIDLLLISNIDYIGLEYFSKIEKLKNDILSGNSNSGFEVQCKEIQKKIEDTVNNLRLNSLPIIVKFIFGPCLPFKDSIHLHIMGPITKSQFILFCKFFPFHSKSMMIQSKIISGNVVMSEFDKNIKLEKNEYKKLSLSLKERVEKSENSIDIEKCIRKITLNFNLLKRNICEHNVLDLSSELKHKYSILPNEVAYLKSRFLDIYKKTCDEIDEI